MPFSTETPDVVVSRRRVEAPELEGAVGSTDAVRDSELSALSKRSDSRERVLAKADGTDGKEIRSRSEKRVNALTTHSTPMPTAAATPLGGRDTRTPGRLTRGGFTCGGLTRGTPTCGTLA